MSAAKHGSLNGDGTLDNTLKKLAIGQAEFVRQTLREAVMQCEQPLGNLPAKVKANFVSLCDLKMKKLRFVMEEVRKRQVADYEAEAKKKKGANNNFANGDGIDSITSEKYSTHAHAPTFQKGETEEGTTATITFISPASVIKGDNLSALFLNNLKGSKKKVARQKVIAKTRRLANNLESDNFAVMDNFLDQTSVRNVRSEIDALDPHFTPSEIWVGKGADVGAQIVVPDVRGDKVLWMCGGHLRKDSSLFDSAGEQPRGKGAIEPCDAGVKVKLGTKIDKGGSRTVSASVMAQFSGMKALLESVDKLVFGELKDKVRRLSRLTARR